MLNGILVQVFSLLNCPINFTASAVAPVFAEKGISNISESWFISASGILDFINSNRPFLSLLTVSSEYSIFVLKNIP